MTWLLFGYCSYDFIIDVFIKTSYEITTINGEHFHITNIIFDYRN